jgi:pyruvate/2-oxoglutarate dehydrogenase complex dihydrolipoamide acyltransferase (E2) component
MAVVDVKLPNLGDDAGDEARVSFWHVDVGDSVREGADLVQMLTDKAVFDVPSPATGRVVESLAAEDQTVKVGGLLCRLEVKD